MHRTKQSVLRSASRLTASAIALAAGLAIAAPAQAGDRHHHHGKKHDTFLKKPLLLRDFGSFYIGGVPKVTDFSRSTTPYTDPPPDPLSSQYWAPNTNSIMIGQMYVQFMIPYHKKKGAIPVINVHGSTHTGAALESTPDEDEGWMPYMARKGIPVYTVDQPGRGRSGFDHSVIHEAEYLFNQGDIEGGSSLLPTIGRISSNTAWTAWFGHLFATSNRNDCTLSTNILTGYLSQHGARPCDPGNTPGGGHPPGVGYRPAFAINWIDQPQMPPNLAPLGPFPDPHLGPTPAGPRQYYLLKYYKQLVPNMEVTLPGSTCETCVPQNISPANTWSPFDQALLVERLGKAIIATHSQSGIQGHHAVRVLRERGSLKKLKALITLEGGCSFEQSGLKPEDFDDVAYLALVGDYTDDSPTCMASVEAINARRAQGHGRAKAEYVKLDDPRFGGAFNGTTHMMMLGTNQLKVADFILNWVDRNVRK
jgi:hypothetical protein